MANLAGKSSLTDDDIHDTLTAWGDHYPNLSAAARDLKIGRNTLRARLAGLGLRNTDGTWLQEPPTEVDEIVLPQFPDEDISAPEILDQMEVRFTQQIKYYEALKWFEIKVKSDDPIGVCWVGDPHLGPHCNIPLLKRDVKIMSETPGVYAVNCGDTGDNWGGRLLRLWAHTDSSRETERILAEWLLKDAGIRWLCWLEGNHENMDGAFPTYLKAINAHRIPMVDWRAQFKLCFPSTQVLCDIAHDFKGNSMWNDLHALERASREAGTELADIYIAGHRHLWEHKKLESGSGRVVTLLRARGYKWIDHFAHRHQFKHKRVGATVMTVIDPKAESPDDVVTPFSNIASGARFLRFLREERK